MIEASDLRTGSNLLLVVLHAVLILIYFRLAIREGYRNGWWYQALGIIQISAGYLVHRSWWLPYSIQVANGGDGAWSLANSFPIIELATLLVLSGACFHAHAYLRRIHRWWWPAGMAVGAGVWALGTAFSITA